MTAFEYADPSAGDLVLRCDACGRTIRAKGVAKRDFRLLWQAAEHIGWEGVESATGPHRCHACAPHPVPTTAPIPRPRRGQRSWRRAWPASRSLGP